MSASIKAGDDMSDASDIRPTQKFRIMDLLEQSGMDVSNWSKDFTGKHPSANPKYCYNWSFAEPDDFIATCLFYTDLQAQDDDIIYADNLRKPLRGKGAAQWKARGHAFDEHVLAAYRDGLPVRAIILEGKRRDDDAPDPESSIVKARYLDPVSWAVTSYDFDTGDFVLRRGASPVADIEQEDAEYSAYEGEERRLYVLHRRRESSLRKKKIMAAMIENSGILKCEVPGCGFDFKACYGKLGEGFAHVHHKRPLAEAPAAGMKISLKDLAVVCANCHAMIHVGGVCRPLLALIPPRPTE
jgi:putative restriction endonuclease